jgi:RHS repeat-associated protein
MANENPNGAGQFTFNLRFHGQYYDRETNLHYNVFRDYDPSIGRYIEFDPIGLRGGINGFIYVGGNPLSFTDPLGLASATKGQSANKAMQDLPDSSSDYWPAGWYKKHTICIEEKCTRTDGCHTWTVTVTSWLPDNPPADNPDKDCVCTRRAVVDE